MSLYLYKYKGKDPSYINDVAQKYFAFNTA